MDKLQEIMTDFESLTEKKYSYELMNHYDLDIIFKTENFPHVAGLHKLINIKYLEKLKNKKITGKKIYNKLKSNEITSDMIFTSPYYRDIENRFEYFFKIKELVFEKVIYNFDRSKVRSKIGADLVLYTIENNLYIHLFLVKHKNGYYSPMTFIVECDDKYVRGQIDYNIKRISVVEDGKNNIEYVYINECTETAKEVAVCENN